jgi:hypothetical protein
MFTFCGIMAAAFAGVAWVITYLEKADDNDVLTANQRRALDKWRGLTERRRRKLY